MSGEDLTTKFLTAAKIGDVKKLSEYVESVDGNAIDVNSADNKKYTALHKACSKGHLNCVRYLIERGANVNASAEGKISPLHLATEGCHTEIVKELVQNGSIVDQCTNSGDDSPLHWLVKNPQGTQKVDDMKEIINVLHEHGANLNLKNHDDNTALHITCYHPEYTEIAQELLRLGAKTDILDKDSRTPSQLAKFLRGSEDPIFKVFEKSNEMLTDGSHDTSEGQIPSEILLQRALSSFTLENQNPNDIQADGPGQNQAFQNQRRQSTPGNKPPSSPDGGARTVVLIRTESVTVGSSGYVIVGDNTSVTQTSSQTNSPTSDVPRQRKVLWTKTSIKHRDKFEKLVNVLETEPEKAIKIGTYSVCLNSDFDIGQGSDGTTVYIGLCDDGMEVAVKSLLRDRCEHLGSNEKEILNYVKVRKEQHIVNYRFYTVDSRNVYLILDLCEETLEKYVLSAESSKAMLESKGVTFLRQILLGLKALHCGDPEILHRDIKPSNIFVNVEGELVLADFGISRKLIKGQTTYRSGQKGTLGWIAVESLPTEDEGDCLSIEEEKVRYKKQSDIQVTGMVLFYILTKGKHPYGKSDSRRHLHLSEGKPVNLNNVSDPLAKDLIEWMLQHDLKERPGVEECLKHPYLMSTDEMFHFVTRVGNELEIKTKDVTSVVVTQLNADLSLPKPSWKATIDTEVMSYMSGHRVYSDDVADLLRFIRNTAEHWGDKTPPTTVQAKVGTPKEYFLNLFPTLPVVLHRIIRKNPVWKQREQLKQFF